MRTPVTGGRPGGRGSGTLDPEGHSWARIGQGCDRTTCGLVDWLEAAGCIVFIESFGTPRVDGLSQWIDDHPVVLLNSEAPIDRQRWTLAHETGHLCMHSNYIGSDP